MHERGVEWHSQPLKKCHFQLPTASHMSGVRERLIRSVRQTMKAVIGHKGGCQQLRVGLNARQDFHTDYIRTIFNS